MLIWESKGREKELSQGQFFCPKCNVLRPYQQTPVPKMFTFYFIPLFETKNLGEAVECQVCKNGFDPKVLEPAHQGMFKLAAATRYELLHGTSPDEARGRLEAVGLQDEMVDAILGMAQN
jgi:zinc-ribbon family